MNSPFTHAKQFPFSKNSNYYAAVLTLPAKKLFKNKEYQNMDQKEQMFVLNEIINKLDYKDNIKYSSFEYHPNRNNKKPCLHANLMFEHQPDIAAPKLMQCIFFGNLKKITGSTMIEKICYYDIIKTEIDAYNWVNYIFKDYADHFEQLTDYREDLIEWAHEENYKDRHYVTPNPLDHK